MLAQAEDLDILDNDHFIVLLVKDGVADHVAQLLLVTAGEMQQRLGISLGRVFETGPIWIFSEAFENRLDCFR